MRVVVFFEPDFEYLDADFGAEVDRTGLVGDDVARDGGVGVVVIPVFLVVAAVDALEFESDDGDALG